nr:alpha/beta fold hydrolase [Methylomarinum sp. Ch1-1]MDP4520104.1 hypothetical protein [Methylomarinum sp. Ch1-1]
MSHRTVLVHGIFNSAYVFTVMRKRLEARGIECFAPSLKPRDGRHGIEDLALKLKTAIDERFGEDQSIHLIGFSMGGIVARYYLQKLEGHQRVKLFSPFHRPIMAVIWPIAIPAKAPGIYVRTACCCKIYKVMTTNISACVFTHTGLRSI